jgi:hypothetical protein
MAVKKAVEQKHTHPTDSCAAQASTQPKHAQAQTHAQAKTLTDAQHKHIAHHHSLTHRRVVGQRAHHIRLERVPLQVNDVRPMAGVSEHQTPVAVLTVVPGTTTTTTAATTTAAATTAIATDASSTTGASVATVAAAVTFATAVTTTATPTGIVISTTVAAAVAVVRGDCCCNRRFASGQAAMVHPPHAHHAVGLARAGEVPPIGRPVEAHDLADTLVLEHAQRFARHFAPVVTAA